MNTTAPVLVNSFEPRMVAGGRIRYRHYLITTHALERYIERIGGDAGNMITDLGEAWIFNFDQAGLDRELCRCAKVADREGAYALGTHKAMFIVRPGQQHIVVTTLSMPTPRSGARNGK